MKDINELECGKFIKSDYEVDGKLINKNDKCRPFPWLLYFSSFTANLLLITSGQNMVWMSPSLSKLLSNNTAINPIGTPITVIQISTVAFIGPIFGVLALIPSAKLSDAIGRKKTILIFASLFFCNSFLGAFGNHISCYYIYNIITGLCASGCLVCVPVYNNEIAEDGNRGRLGCLMGTSIPFGILLTYLIGPLTSIRNLFLINSIIPLLHLVFSFIIPESPVYLSLKGKKDKSVATLQKLRRCNDYGWLEMEFNKLELFILNDKGRSGRFFDIFRNRASRKAFFLSIGVASVQQLSGIFVILAFMSSIFGESDNTTKLSGDNFAIIAGVVQLCVFSLSASVIEKSGRRPLLLLSSFICSMSLFSLGVYFHLKHIDSTYGDDLIWLPIISVLLYIIGYGLGLGPIPVSFTGELFPNDLRATGVASILVIDNSAICLNMGLFPIAVAYLGVQYCVWFYSFCCCLGFIGMFAFLPETKGKSFAEIQKMLKK